MLLPYNIDRPIRCTPYVTYSLMGINIFIFLATVFVAMVYLPVDRLQSQTTVKDFLTHDRDAVRAKIRILAKAEPSVTNEQIDSFIDGLKESSNKHDYKSRRESALLIQILTQVALDKANTEEGYKRYWQLTHVNSRYVLEPHYSVLNSLAYRPADPSIPGKLVGLFFSMFLHGGILHIVGNMIFLWAFGRALEETLGPWIYLGSYILCGVAATMLHHIMTMTFAPLTGSVPSMGASGAIAGVMGLFALRFYRTRIFTPKLFIILSVVGILMQASQSFWNLSVNQSFWVAVVTTGVGAVMMGKPYIWGAVRMPSPILIGIWFLWFNLMPALQELIDPDKSGNVAHWAHIGGFLFGMLYALLIGSQEEGRSEYLQEDSEKAFEEGDIANAIKRAQRLLQREPNSAAAYEVLAKSFDSQKNEDAALDNYELAIQNYIRIGERDQAARIYQLAVQNHPRFIMPATTQLILGNQMAKNGDFAPAADALVKIPYTFPDAPEGEVSLLRCAQLYVQHLNMPERALTLSQLFMQRYPDSPWMQQAQQTASAAQLRLSENEAAPAARSRH